MTINGEVILYDCTPPIRFPRLPAGDRGLCAGRSIDVETVRGRAARGPADGSCDQSHPGDGWAGRDAECGLSAAPRVRPHEHDGLTALQRGAGPARRGG